MKQNFKTYLKFGLFLFGVSFIIYSCQNDDLDNFDQTQQIKVNPYDISLSQFKQQTKINNLRGYLKTKSINTSSKQKEDLTFDDFIIDTTLVKLYLLDSLRPSFSFKISLKDSVVIGENYNLFIRQKDSVWVSSIMLFVDDNDTSNGIRFSHIEELHSLDGIHARHNTQSNNTLVTRGSGEWSQTTYYHCTNSGECLSGICDGCSRCTSTSTTYHPDFTAQGDNGDDQGGGTDGGMYNGGGGGGGAASYYDPNDTNDEEDDDFISDCNLLENLSTSPDFANKMQELINNTSGNTEIGYFGSTDSNGETTFPVRVESPENVRGFDTNINSTEQVDVFMHNHFNNGQGSLSVFSGSDLYTLYQLYLNGNITDTDNYVMLVATPGGNSVNDEETVYAITIKNETNFATFGANFLHDFFLTDNLYNNDTNLISPNISNALNEERFAKLLKTLNSGLTVFKGDKDNLSSWSKLRVKNNNTLTEKDCN